jgi:hypothetical protein
MHNINNTNIKLGAIQTLMAESSLGPSHGDEAVADANCKMSHFGIDYISSGGGVKWTAPFCVGDGDGPSSPHYAHSYGWTSLNGDYIEIDCNTHGTNDLVIYLTVNDCIYMHNTHQATKDKMLLQASFYGTSYFSGLGSQISWENIHEMIEDSGGTSRACIARMSGELPPLFGDSSDSAGYVFRVLDGINMSASGYGSTMGFGFTLT